jgi:hypothetical protein
MPQMKRQNPRTTFTKAGETHFLRDGGISLIIVHAHLDDARVLEQVQLLFRSAATKRFGFHLRTALSDQTLQVFASDADLEVREARDQTLLATILIKNSGGCLQGIFDVRAPVKKFGSIFFGISLMCTNVHRVGSVLLFSPARASFLYFFFVFPPPRGNFGRAVPLFRGPRGNFGCFDVLFWHPAGTAGEGNLRPGLYILCGLPVCLRGPATCRDLIAPSKTCKNPGVGLGVTHTHTHTHWT